MLSDDNDDIVEPVSSLQLLTTTMIFLPVPVITAVDGCAGVVMLEAMKFARRNIVAILAVMVVEKRLISSVYTSLFLLLLLSSLAVSREELAAIIAFFQKCSRVVLCSF